jgi:phenylalanine-4-hydroxylase
MYRRMSEMKPQRCRKAQASTEGNHREPEREVWKTLGTSHLSVAKARLGQFLQEHREHNSQVFRYPKHMAQSIERVIERQTESYPLGRFTQGQSGQ